MAQSDKSILYHVVHMAGLASKMIGSLVPRGLKHCLCSTVPSYTSNDVGF